MFANHGSAIYVPDGISIEEALDRTTHLGIAAHADDLEIMAYHGISECFCQNDRWFFGVVITDGAGSPRVDTYSHLTNAEIRQIRRNEQKKAASIGEYGGLALLDYSSSDVKQPVNPLLSMDLRSILTITRPNTLYLHQPADQHKTHVAAFMHCIHALKELPESLRPQRILGCEVWGSLEWLPEEVKIRLNAGDHPHIAKALLRVFDSQIHGGKRYDKGTLGRRIANAVFDQSHAVDRLAAMTLAMDLTPLVNPPYPSPQDWIGGLIDEFKSRVLEQIRDYESGFDKSNGRA